MRLMFLDAPVRTPRSGVLLVMLASLWLAVFGNIALWRTLRQLPDITGWHGFAFGVAFAIIIASVVTVVLSLFA